MSQQVRFRVLELFKNDCGTVLRDTGLLERVMKTSGFAASLHKQGAHRAVKSAASISAAIKVLPEKKKESLAVAARKIKRVARRTTNVFA